jgi:hypothetical protein
VYYRRDKLHPTADGRPTQHAQPPSNPLLSSDKLIVVGLRTGCGPRDQSDGVARICCQQLATTITLSWNLPFIASERVFGSAYLVHTSPPVQLCQTVPDTKQRSDNNHRTHSPAGRAPGRRR